jgi:hypothetical protein
MLTNRRLPDQVDLTFGPPALIGRFILHADQTTRERGVYLSLEHDFDALIEFNKTQASSWFPMIPTFDPEFSDLTPENAFWIAGRDRDGEIVACQCARLFDWRDTNFKQEFESLRLVYQDPDIERLPEECTFSEVPSPNGPRPTRTFASCPTADGWLPSLGWTVLEQIGVDWNRRRRSHQPRESAPLFRW